jgi:hypothetical protein
MTYPRNDKNKNVTKEILSSEAKFIQIGVSPLEIPLSVDDFSHLREEGQLKIEVPLTDRKFWYLTEPPVIHLTSPLPDPFVEPGENSEPSAEPEPSVAPEPSTKPEPGKEIKSPEEPGSNTNSPAKNSAPAGKVVGAKKLSDQVIKPQDKNDQQQKKSSQRSGDKKHQSPKKKRPHFRLPLGIVTAPKPPKEPLPDKKDSEDKEKKPEGYGPPDPNAKRGTWLAANDIKDRSQDLTGLWWWVHNGGKELVRFVRDPKTGELTVHAADNLNVSSVHAKLETGEKWTGEVYTTARDGVCPEKGWWQPATLNIRPGSLTISGEWKGKMIDRDACSLTEEPQGGPLRYERYMASSFAQIVGGKYFHIMTSPAIGNQAGQFKVAARIVTDLNGTPADRVQAFAGDQPLHPVGDGAFEFLADGSGTYQIRVELIDSNGEIIHTDRLQIDVPSIPGIAQ